MAQQKPRPPDDPLDRLVGETPAVTALRAQIRHLAAFDRVGNPHVPTLLLHGETGTGKGLIARLVHDSGPRAAGPFVEINCAALPETLLEAELFGFEAGAFTDAKRAKPGLFEAASGGTLFLDEIDALPLSLQGKLLTAVEAKQVRRLGAVAGRPVDVKLIVATQTDLAAAVAAGRFRADLYHRLAVVVLEVPPLHQRGADVVLLARHFLQSYAAGHGLSPKRLTAEAEAWLQGYAWPGNVRELSHLMERVTLLCAETVLGPAALAQQSLLGGGTAAQAQPEPIGDGPGERDEVARIRQALLQTGGNVTRAARLLGLSRKALRYRLGRYGIERHRLGQPAPPADRPPPAAPRPGDGPDGGARDRADEAGVGWEQKPVAVLAIDLTFPYAPGPAALPAEPWTATRRWEQIIVEKVQGFGGVFWQRALPLMTALFGLPRTLEQLPHRAIQAALAIRHLVEEARRRTDRGPPPEVRLAVHQGPVLANILAPDPTARLPAMGDTLTQPVRLLGHAAPGELLVSAQVARLVEEAFALQARARPADAGHPDRVVAYAVVGQRLHQAGPAEGWRRARSPFVGRERELTMLHDLLAEVEAGLGQVVGIVGEPGIGKSRLLREFQQGLSDKPVTYVEGRCFAYGEAMPYLPVVEILRQYAGIAELDAPEAVADKVHRSLQAVGMDPEAAAPYLLRLLGLERGTDALAGLAAEAVRAGTIQTLCQLFLGASRRQPLVLAVENLHWIDPGSAQCLASLVDRLLGKPILLLCTYRPGAQPPWLQKSYATQLTIKPLSPRHSLYVVQSVLQTEQLPETVAQAILAKAEGNPFFLEELARAVVERGELSPASAVPDTIQDLLLARIDRAPDGPRRLLQTLAVLGREASPRLLEALWQDASTLGLHLQELERQELLYEHTGGGGLNYVVKHALIQEVAYESIPHARRQALHAAAAGALEAVYAGRLEEVYDRLAYHYAKTAAAAEAIAYLMRFAEKAARSYAHVEAVKAFEEALAQVAHLPEPERHRRRLEVSLRLAFSLSVLGRFRQILELLLPQREPLEQLQEPALAGPYHFRLALTYSYLGAQEQATQSAERALAEAKRCGDRATMGQAYYVLALQDFWLGQPLPGVEHGRQAVALLEGTDERHWLGLSHWVLGINHYLLGEFAPALEAEARAAAIGDATGDPRIQSFAAWSRGWIWATLGEWEAAIEACQRGFETAPDQLTAVAALGYKGYAYLEKGDAAQAIPLLEQVVRQFEQWRMRQTQGRFMVFLSEAYLLGGEIDRARELATQGLAISQTVKSSWGIGWGQRTLGQVAHASGALCDAAAYFQQALQTFAAMPARFEAARTHLALAELAHAQGNLEALTAHLERASAMFNSVHVPRYVERVAQLANEWGVSFPADLVR
jgi:DNA-binding NtrC family response regulator/tetratricopeptide (TPR) repeat protein